MRLAARFKDQVPSHLQPRKLVTHRFPMNGIMKAYATFDNAAKRGALKMVLTNGAPR